MSSSFFTVPGALKKRKRIDTTRTPNKKRNHISSAPPKPALQRANPPDDDSISGSDSENEVYGDGASNVAREEESEPENDRETAAEKRLRLAEQYLENVRQEVDEAGFDAADLDRDIIADRLRDDVASSKGKVYKRLASQLALHRASHTLFRNNTHSTTSVATCPPYAYTVTKDRCLAKWKLQELPENQNRRTTRRKSKKLSAPPRRQPDLIAASRGNKNTTKDPSYKGHTGEILSVAASEDGQFVVTAGADKKLIVHDAKTLKPLRVYTHHRDAVTGLAFRRGTNQLYSASKDRTVKVWSLDEGGYIETLFGHQDEVVDIDALAYERCVSVGARDRTARLWKVVEASQLVFRGGAVDKAPKDTIDPRSLAQEGSMDRVAMIDEELFVTGSMNGSLALWSIQKKKPLHVLSQAHGLETPMKPSETSAEAKPDPNIVLPAPQPRWITALRTLPYSDIILSGSWDGFVRVWRLSEDKRKIEAVGVLGSQSHLAADGHLTKELTHEPFTNGSPRGSEPEWKVKGVINDIALFERGNQGLCVIVAVGKEHRLGRWKHIQNGKNGAVIFEVPMISTDTQMADTPSDGES